MAILKDIAKELKVSIATVSYVYNDKWCQVGIRKELADKIKKRLKEVNYRPHVLGLQLKTKKTRTIGVVLGDLSRSFSLDIFAGIEKVLSGTDYMALVCNSNLGALEKIHLETLFARNVEGLIFSPQMDGDTTAILKNKFRAEKIPVVMVDNYLPQLKADFVVSDNFFGAYQAVKFLISKKYKKIAYLGAGKKLASLKDRFKGYSMALREAGLSVPGNLVCRKIAKPEDVSLALKEIFNKEQPEAIFSESLLYFKDSFRFLLEKKLVISRDIGLTGFDPISLSSSEMIELNFHTIAKKPVPFIQQDGIKMGESAAQILLKKIKGNRRKMVNIFLKPKLQFFEF